MDVSPHYRHLVGEIPRLRGEIFADSSLEPSAFHSGSALLPWLVEESTISPRIKAGEALYPMPGVRGSWRFQAQLWWWSVCGSIVNPMVSMIVCAGHAPELDWDRWTCFERDSYWLGFFSDSCRELPADSAEDVIDYGSDLVGFLTPFVTAVAEFGQIKPAPVWAVVADAVAAAAVSAGNELMTPWVGAAVGDWLVQGMSRHTRVPLPRFVDVSEDGVEAVDMEAARGGEEGSFDAVTHLLRSSCCMIYRCPGADLCMSCPRRSREDREADWLASVMF